MRYKALLKQIPILLSLFIFLPIKSQVKGHLIDAFNYNPIIGASVFAKDSGLNFNYVDTTDKNGNFHIKAIPDSIKEIKISFTGYDTLLIDTITSSDLGTLLIYPKNNVLEEIVVAADRRKQDSSTETIYLNDSIRKSASNAVAMIGNLQGFKVDWITEKINIGGELDVPILVNEREVTMKYARSLNPKRIKLLQILRHPPGKYSDYPAIINIELFENYEGWDISAKTTGRLSLKNKHSNSENIQVDGTLTKNNWNAYVSSSYGRSRQYQAESFLTEISGNELQESKPIDISAPNKSQLSSTGSITLGTDHRFNSSHTVSLQASLDHSKFDGYSYFDMIVPEGQRINRNDYNSDNLVSGLFYRGKFGGNFKLTSLLLYNYYKIKETRNLTFLSDHDESMIKGKKDYVNFNVDGAYTFSKKWDATLSYDYILRKYHSSENASTYFISNESRNNIEGTVSYSKSNKFDIRVGLNMLLISTSGQDTTSHNLSWIPRLNLYWKPFRQLSLTMIYRNYTDYPNLDQLSTSSWQITPNILQTGNPYLRSRIMHYASAKLNLFRYLSLEYLFRYSKDDIVEWYEFISDDMLKKTFINCNYLFQYIGFSIDKELGYGINLNYVGSYQWTKRWMGNHKNRGRVWYSDLTLTWSPTNMPMSILVEYFLRHDKEPLPQGEIYSQGETLELGINYSFLNRRLPISLVFNFPVSLLSKTTYTKINIPGFRDETYRDNRINSFAISLNIRFNLGKGKVNKEYNSYYLDKEK